MFSPRHWYRQRILRRFPLSPEAALQLCHSLPILHGLSLEQQTTLVQRAILFLHDKHLSCLGDLQPSPAEQLHLALQAQLPLLCLPEADWYRGFHEILLYPAEFRAAHSYRDAAGISHETRSINLGETWAQGPVILAWPGVQHGGGWTGHNLVIHELVHKLDLLDGAANGLPPLHRDMPVAAWAADMQAGFDRLQHSIEHGHPLIDPYAATDPAEFLAVTSEYFFADPGRLAGTLPAVYSQLRAFYRQDPLTRRA